MALGTGAIMGLVGAGVQGVTGLGQLIAGLAMHNERPTKVIPPEIEANLNQAQIQYLQGLPDEQYNQAIQNFQRNLAFGARQLQDRNSAIGGIASLVQQANDATLGLDVADANARFNNLQNLYAARKDMANERNIAWDWNARQKYLENAEAKQGLIGAGIQNLTGGINTGMSGFAQDNFANMYKGGNQNNFWNMIMGMKNQNPYSGVFGSGQGYGLPQGQTQSYPY